VTAFFENPVFTPILTELVAKNAAPLAAAAKCRPITHTPATRISVVGHACCGEPNLDKACTSHIERQNLTIRMQNRRMTRLTNAFSKKWANHQASLALHFATYNFITPHGTLTKNTGEAGERTKTTPAMAAGMTDHPWTMEELLLEMTGSTH